jgi:hypothetical protein
MFSWLKRMFRRDAGYNQFSQTQDKLKGMGFETFTIFSEGGLDIYERAKAPLGDEDETISRELTIASHKKDNEKIVEIGKRLDASGGIDRMKLICYRVRNLGGDDRWIEMKG